MGAQEGATGGCHPLIEFRNMGGTYWIRSAGLQGVSRRVRFLGAIRLGASRLSNKVGGTYWQPRATSRRGGWHRLSASGRVIRERRRKVPPSDRWLALT